jgi:hypothetical protein
MRALYPTEQIIHPDAELALYERNEPVLLSGSGERSLRQNSFLYTRPDFFVMTTGEQGSEVIYCFLLL